MAEIDQDFLEYVVKGLVDHPEKVSIGRTVDEMGVLLTLDLDPEDMGKVIGRQGNTAKAIRTLLRVVGMKHNARVNLKINEPPGGTGGAPRAERTAAEAPAAAAASNSPAMKTVDEAMAELEL